ncbi:MAG: M23 family metallopeptidase [Defluviitaleaceae bacterium]|nr:M23 family metallopeptidase [Defluviitaleaceae bacterium]
MRSREIKRKAGIRTIKKAGATAAILSRLKMPNLRRLRFSFPQPGVMRARRLKEYFFRVCVIAIIILFAAAAFRLVRPGIRVRVDPDTVAAFRVPHRAIGMLRTYAARNGIHFPELFAVFNAENNFFPEKHAVYDLSVLEYLYVADFDKLLRSYNTRSISPYVQMFDNLFSEIETFPIPTGWYEYDASIMFGDSWGVEHNFQGRPMQMGTAIIDRKNIRGRVPVVSMTRGTVYEAGWDNQLGYFVKIYTENSTLFLYAHLDSLTPGLIAGREISPGHTLGQMGNSGGGRSGRSFPVHLHLAISPSVSFTRGNFWINPYPLLRYIENPTGF